MDGKSINENRKVSKIIWRRKMQIWWLDWVLKPSDGILRNQDISHSVRQ